MAASSFLRSLLGEKIPTPRVLNFALALRCAQRIFGRQAIVDWRARCTAKSGFTNYWGRGVHPRQRPAVCGRPPKGGFGHTPVHRPLHTHHVPTLWAMWGPMAAHVPQVLSRDPKLMLAARRTGRQSYVSCSNEPINRPQAPLLVNFQSVPHVSLAASGVVLDVPERP